jgi:hypothetical protein
MFVMKNACVNGPLYFLQESHDYSLSVPKHVRAE